MEDQTEHKKHCFVCETDGAERVMLACSDKGEDKWVCVRCLPYLIHGVDH